MIAMVERPATNSLKQEVCDAIDRLRAELIAVSRGIHSEPELNFQEVKAAARLTGAAERHGLKMARGAYGLPTAFESDFGSAGSACVAILAEYDALPEIGHACGHNLIATAALGASLALAQLGDRLPGRVRFLGTPAEEGGGGKELMARQGAFNGVDAAMMIHPYGCNLATMPTLAITAVTATYHGKPAHAAVQPWDGINALDGLVIGYQAIAALRQHIRPTERLHGIITDGGKAANVVPERAAGIFYIRSDTAKSLEVLRQRVVSCLEAGALASGARLQLETPGVDYLDLETNWPLAHSFQRNAEALGREFLSLDHPVAKRAGSTDMGNVSHYVPSIHPMLAAAPADCVIHHPDFARWAASDMGDQAAIDGAKAIAMTALDFFVDEELRAKVTSSFAALGTA
jgi:amidohydrolase